MKKKRQGQKEYHRIHSLRARTILVLCLFLLPFSIGSVILSSYTQRNLDLRLTSTITAAMDSYAKQLEGKMATTDYVLLDISTNNNSFHQYMNAKDWHQDVSRFQLSQSMSNSIKLSSCADAMFLYHTERDDLVWATRIRIGSDRSRAYLEPEDLRNVLSNSLLNDGKWHQVTVEDTVNLFHLIDGSNYLLGAYMDCTEMLSLIYDSIEYKGAQVFLTEEAIPEEKGIQYYHIPLSHSSVQLVYSVDNREFYGSALLWYYLSIAMVVLSVLLIPIFTYLFMRHVDHPLLDLRSAFHELERGNQAYRIATTARSSEFADAEKSFNTMADHLEKMQKTILEDEKKQHELLTNNLQLQLNNLQLQIRPHFLQNTMNLLYTLIYNGQSENAQKLVLYLSRYFRYMFRRGRDLELFDMELEMVKEYLEISALHYENAFTVSYQIDPILGFMRVPPLLFHNFVENIIQHALIPGKTIHIIFYGEYDDETRKALLMISDDGNGMQEEYADRINQNAFEGLPEGKHIGIRNSINRMKHFYGEKAEVRVETGEGAGTTFSFRIPCDLTDISEAPYGKE